MVSNPYVYEGHAESSLHTWTAISSQFALNLIQSNVLPTLMKVEILISTVNQGEIYRSLPINDGGCIDSLLPALHK